MLDKHGNEIEDRIYNLRDFDRTLVLDVYKRQVLVVARRMGMSGADTPLSEKSPATATGMQK